MISVARMRGGRKTGFSFSIFYGTMGREKHFKPPGSKEGLGPHPHSESPGRGVPTLAARGRDRTSFSGPNGLFMNFFRTKTAQLDAPRGRPQNLIFFEQNSTARGSKNTNPKTHFHYFLR